MIFLQALKISDKSGLRFLLMGTPPRNPLFEDVVADITTRIRVRNSAVLAPFGIQAAGSAPAAALSYFRIVNDLY